MESLDDPDRRRGGQGAAQSAARQTASWSTWPTPLRRSARTASSCWNAHGRLDRRREDLDKRQVGLEGLCQRPRTAHGARAAAHLPALAARRGDPEDRGRTDDGRRLRRRFIGRHHQDHAPQTPRERVGRVAVDAHHTERAPPFLYAKRQHQHPHGPPRPLRLGMGRPGQGHGRLGRTHRLQHGQYEPHVPFGNRRTRPQLRRQHRLGIRNQPQAQHRRRVRILAQQRKGPERLL